MIRLKWLRLLAAWVGGEVAVSNYIIMFYFSSISNVKRLLPGNAGGNRADTLDTRNAHVPYQSAIETISSYNNRSHHSQVDS